VHLNVVIPPMLYNNYVASFLPISR